MAYHGIIIIEVVGETKQEEENMLFAFLLFCLKIFESTLRK
ncbi:MAG: hypothetical protein UY04_C0013G0011 [Parcubacteria group bacterium GW2011_GWA2_47_7]|nr:MAG: hypothetical protein UY04_C0013G0011 [Parcubacteria group bacterium GW2011_GWA2_47_7]